VFSDCGGFAAENGDVGTTVVPTLGPLSVDSTSGPTQRRIAADGRPHRGGMLRGEWIAHAPVGTADRTIRAMSALRNNRSVSRHAETPVANPAVTSGAVTDTLANGPDSMQNGNRTRVAVPTTREADRSRQSDEGMWNTGSGVAPSRTNGPKVGILCHGRTDSATGDDRTPFVECDRSERTPLPDGVSNNKTIVVIHCRTGPTGATPGARRTDDYCCLWNANTLTRWLRRHAVGSVIHGRWEGVSSR